MPIPLAVNGALGRMGRRIIELAREDKSFRVVAALEAPGHPTLGQDWGTETGGPPASLPLACELSAGAGVLVDFSTPSGAMHALEGCLRTSTPIVIGTTGLKGPEQKRLEEATGKIPVLLAPNMSVGVNVLLQVAPLLARALGPGYDVEIVEIHHRFKQDAPSGTALRIAERLAEALGRDLEEKAVHGRSGVVPRAEGEIGIHALRGGDVAGDHTVVFAGPGERIELIHRAHTRDTFAYGALRAAKFLAGKPPGRYTIEEALGL